MKTTSPYPHLLSPVFWLALSLAAPVQAASPPMSDTPADYAYELPLQVTGKQGVVGLRLPQSVYIKAKTAGLDDVRVFDAKGVAQPFSLYRPPVDTVAQRVMLAASVFPLHTRVQAENSAAIDIDIETRPDGTVRSVKARTAIAKKKSKGKEQEPVQESTEERLTNLILDFGAAMAGYPLRIEALRFGAPKDRSNYTAEVWLEASNDLKRWETVGAAELSWLSNDSAQTLANDRLEFSPQKFRYARLSWRRGEPALFSSIRAETVSQQHSEPLRETLWVKPQPGRFPGDLAYTTGVALPVEQISLKLSEPNIVYPMLLGHYVEQPGRQGGKATEWIFRPRSSATFYQITQDEQVRRSGALSVPVGRLAQWVIRPLNAGATAQPELGVSWQPATLVFLAGGTPPYVLGFGREDAQAASQPLAQVAPGFSADELGRLEQAQAGELRESAAKAAAESAAVQAAISARKRTFILWGVLLLGVVVLGGMAWRLIRQMKAAANLSDPDAPDVTDEPGRTEA